MAIVVQPHFTESEVLAVRACAEGVANAQQAKLALDWVMREACRHMTSPALELPPDASQHDLAIAEGRRVVGSLIRDMFLPHTLDAAKVANGNPATIPAPRPRINRKRQK